MGSLIGSKSCLLIWQSPFVYRLTCYHWTMSFQVPDQTSINKDEFRPDKYAIAFAPELVQFIIDNLKLTTYRFGDKYDYLQIGDQVGIQSSASGEIVARAKITDKSWTTFRDLPLENHTHEAYRDKDHQRQVLSGYYAYLGRPIADDDRFLVFDFELVR